MLLLPLIVALSSPPNLRTEGAFGFPQKEATVLCDTPKCRVSIWNNTEYLFLQAVIFADTNNSIGETDDGRAIGDWLEFAIDVNGDGKADANIDRAYHLNPWPHLDGLHYSVSMGENASSGLRNDSKGRGAISYLPAAASEPLKVPAEGTATATAPADKIRVDTFLIPLSELPGLKPGDSPRILFWASSANPSTTFNSLSMPREVFKYPHSIPTEEWHKWSLADRTSAVDVQLVPEVRDAAGAKPAPKLAPMPKIGKKVSELPEITAESWINWPSEIPPTFASLKGKVIVLEFWATWCNPCVRGIPHLNKLNDAHSGKGLVVLSFTDQSRNVVEKFMERTPMRYKLGVKSSMNEAYGVNGIPHAFIIGRDGTLLWHGHPDEEKFDQIIMEELDKRK